MMSHRKKYRNWNKKKKINLYQYPSWMKLRHSLLDWQERLIFLSCKKSWMKKIYIQLWQHRKRPKGQKKMPKELKPLIIPFFLWCRHKKKESIGYIGSTIRERNKNNAKYYFGDYSHLVSSKLDEVFLSTLWCLAAMWCIFGQKRLRCKVLSWNSHYEANRWYLNANAGIFIFQFL